MTADVGTGTTISTSVNGDGRHLGLAVDGTSAYWGSLDGNLYRCQKASCDATRSVMVAGARPFAITQDSGFVYWSYFGDVVYRAKKSKPEMLRRRRAS